MAKKIGGLEEDVVIMGGVLVGGYILIKNLFPSLLPNLGVSDADRTNLDQQQNTPGSLNIFSYDSVSAGNWAANNYDWSHFDTSDAYLNAAFNDFKHGNLSPSVPIYPVMIIYYDLFKALIGHLYSGDQDAANSALNAITNKWQVGIIAELFQVINGKNFWDVLRNGVFPMIHGLNGTDLSAQVTRLNNLPD